MMEPGRGDFTREALPLRSTGGPHSKAGSVRLIPDIKLPRTPAARLVVLGFLLVQCCWSDVSECSC